MIHLMNGPVTKMTEEIEFFRNIQILKLINFSKFSKFRFRTIIQKNKINKFSSIRIRIAPPQSTLLNSLLQLGNKFIHHLLCRVHTHESNSPDLSAEHSEATSYFDVEVIHHVLAHLFTITPFRNLHGCE